jgi:hypothetical protein
MVRINTCPPFVVAYHSLSDMFMSRYVPVIPTVLVNGATGIGTGFSTDIPTYHPLQIIDNIRYHYLFPATPFL